jgi:hypothetical protein
VAAGWEKGCRGLAVVWPGAGRFAETLLVLEVFVVWTVVDTGGILADEASEGEGSRVRSVVCRREGAS